MNRIKKVAITIGITTMLFVSLANTSLANSIVYEDVQEEIISSGVTHKKILRFGQGGWLQLNAVYIDLDNNNTELDILTSREGLATKEHLSSMVKDKKEVVAAINADFFYMLNPDSPLGAIVKDGDMISSPVTAHNYATFYVDYGDQAFAEYWQHQIYATTSSGVHIPISSINKYTDEYQYTMLIDRNWGTHSPGYSENLENMAEIVVVDDIVVEIREKQPAVEIPENGYVLLASQGKSEWAHCDRLLASVNLGDEITIHKDIEPDLENIKLAVGGGTILVKDGQVVTEFTQNVSGAHPRTAVGITKDRKQIILVTIDGRHSSYKGVDGKQMAEILIELGSDEAIMMDGGGSTTMRARPQGEFSTILANNYSDGSERRITNGLAILSKAEQGNLQEIKLVLDDNRGFVGASRKISLKAIDENFNPLGVDYSRLNLSLVQGEGTFDGVYFTPTKAGQVIIEAEYLGVRTETSLEVLEDLSYIKISPNPIKIDQGKSINLSVVGVDSEGYSAKINPKDVTWLDQKGLGIFKEGVYLTGEKSGTTVIEGHFGYRTDKVNVTIEGLDSLNIDDTNNPIWKTDNILGNKEEKSKDKSDIIQDKYNRPYEAEGEQLFIYSGVKLEKYTLLDRIIMNKIADLSNNHYDLSMFTGSLDSRLANNIKKETLIAKSGYGSKEQGKNLIIQLDNIIDGIRQTNFDQWPWFKNLIKNTDKENIFILMSKPIYGEGGFTDKLEAELLMNILSDLTKEGKKVFVLYEGKDLSVDIIEGVRYISTGGYNSDPTKNPNEAFKYIEFNINDSEVTYQIKQLFE